MHVDHQERAKYNLKDKVQNVCNEQSLDEKSDVTQLFFSFFRNTLRRIPPFELASHYGVFNHRAKSDSRTWTCRGNLYVALSQRSLLRL